MIDETSGSLAGGEGEALAECSTIDEIEPPWQAIKQWIPADDDEPSFHWQDTHHSNESQWKPREIPLGDDRILVLDVD